MTKISGKSYELAEKHINRYYDSDFYPRPFEFKAIKHNWDEVYEKLTKLNLSDYSPVQPVFHAAPKAGGGYRIVHQLSPIDSIIYTALAFEISEDIEEMRIKTADDSICSYRINSDNEGNFFAKGNGYKKFVQRSIELAKSNKYVLTTDISDFYNQIYLHRLQNVIGTTKGKQIIATSIEKFLMQLSTKVSKGVPVGPAASIIMAEAVLIDVDQFLSRKGLDYVRYVDDIRIFDDSKTNLNKLLNEFVIYLYSNHRLSLNHKTIITDSEDFLKKNINSYKDENVRALEKAKQDLNMEIDTGDYDSIEPLLDKDKLDSKIAKAIQLKQYESLMESIVELPRLNLGLARNVLRKSKDIKGKSILKPVLENFDFFTPVLRDVILYLIAVSSRSTVERNLAHFESAFIKNPTSTEIPYINYWISHLITNNSNFLSHKMFKNYILNNQHDHKIRMNALYSIQAEDISGVREHKNRIDNYPDTVKRAVMYSSKIMSHDERKSWMSAFDKSEDILIISLAKYLKSL